jgi:hypothetical protein
VLYVGVKANLLILRQQAETEKSKMAPKWKKFAVSQNHTGTGRYFIIFMRFLLAGLRQVFDVVEFVVLITLKRVKLQLNIPQDTLHLCCTQMPLYNVPIQFMHHGRGYPDPPIFLFYFYVRWHAATFFIYFYLNRADILTIY